MAEADKREVSFEIVEDYGIINTGTRGWYKGLKLVKWNNREPKYDIREWTSDNSRCSKGVTFSREELVNLRELLNEMQL